MTTKQRQSILLHRWPSACRTQGWDRNDRFLRLQVISQAVGRRVDSMNDLDNARDIDAVYAHLGYLSDNVARTIELDNADPGDRRRYLHLIRQHSSQLADYGADPIAYALAIARDKHHVTEGWSTIEDLTTEQLRQLVMTLWARIVARRRANKDASSSSEEMFPDQVEFVPETELEHCPF